MDAVEFEALKQKNLPTERGFRVDRFVNRVNRYTQDGTAAEITLKDEGDFADVLKLLNIETVDGSRILHYYAIDTHSGASYDSQATHRPLNLDREVSVWGLLSSLVDRADPGVEDSNYRSTIIIQIDDVTSVAVGEEVQDVSSKYEHEFVAEHWVAMFNTADIEGFTAWHEWDLDQTHAKERIAHKAAQEAREIEREKEEGVTNLSRLKQGDVLRMTLLDRGEVEHVDAWTVVEEGERVVVEIGPDAQRANFAGGGRWTNRKQNPVQHQEVAMSVSWGYVYPGQHLAYWVKGDDDWTFSETTVKSIEVTSEA